MNFDYWLNLPPHCLPNDVLPLNPRLTERETKRLAKGTLLRDTETQFNLPVTTEHTRTEGLRQQAP